MNKFALTGFVLLLMLALILGWDLYVVLRDQVYDNTVSQWVYQTSREFLVLPFLAGVVIGHLIWPIHKGEA